MTHPHAQRIVAELKLMFEHDQDDLRRYKEGKLSQEEIKAAISTRSGRFTQILNECFPDIIHIGVEGYTAGVALVLHSGDIKLMRDYLSQHRKQPSDAINITHRAYIIDKILLAEGNKQRYGTQFKSIIDGKVNFFPLESPESVDERREELSLPTMEKYEQDILRQNQ